MARKRAPATDEEFARQNEAAVREAREAERVEPRAETVGYDAERGLVIVELTSGFAFGFPPERAPGLETATPAQLAEARVSPGGDGLHWDALDAHLSLGALMEAAFNLREWAPRYLGQIRSPAKAAAARENGRKGGRPAVRAAERFVADSAEKPRRPKPKT
ncbi:MAG TPA: DUF2442 domain-containing protein [Longimicrobium sp.]|nr:DUF2442 domain-containing protein [Longimicrobium sp.]